MKIRSISTSKNVMCSIEFAAQIKNQIRRNFHQKRNRFRKTNLFFSTFMMTIVRNYRSFHRRKKYQNTRSNYEKQLFDDIYKCDNNIKNRIKIFVITIFIFIKNKKSIIIIKKQTYVKFFTKRIVYSKDLINLKLTLKIADTQ